MVTEVIVNADDFGQTAEANRGIVRCFEKGLVSEASIVVNSNYFNDAVDLAHTHGFSNRVGLHLNLVEGIPLTKHIRELRTYVLNEKFVYDPRWLEKINVLHVRFLREEIEAQIKKYLNSGFTFSHIDSHHYTLCDLPVWLAVKPLLAKYGIRSIRYIGDSWYDGSKIHQQYCNWLEQEYNHTNLKHLSFIGSIYRYQKQLANNSKKLSNQKAIEIYVHPVQIENRLYDNFTGGKDLERQMIESGLTGKKLISYADI